MLSPVVARVRLFEAEAHKIFGGHEAAPSRVIDARKSLARVAALSVKQQDMLSQAVRCVEVEVFRAAHVLAFAAVVDYLHDVASKDSFNALNSVRPNWKIKTIEDIRDNVADYNFIEAMHAAGLISKSEKKGLHGMLTRRNECAHPSDYYPDINQSLGYISEALARLKTLQQRFG
jgi:hypothetical protein